jgi:hypothetical protein
MRSGGPFKLSLDHIDAPGSTDALPDIIPRREFVAHQQEVAERALHLGAPGAARAALRVLMAIDFEQAAVAAAYLRTLRHDSAESDQVVDAIKALVQLMPAHRFGGR